VLHVPLFAAMLRAGRAYQSKTTSGIYIYTYSLSILINIAYDITTYTILIKIDILYKYTCCIFYLYYYVIHICTV
jgi:hypothetical protein